MKPRSKAGGKASKARGREALKSKRHDASKTASSPARIQDAEVARLTRELNEALERQAATSEVLEVISGSPRDLQPVFAAMLENAVRICDANFGNIYRWDGEALHMLASHNTPPAFAEDRRRSPYRPYPNSPIGRMVANKAVVHISDVRTEDVYTKQLDPVAVTAVTLGGLRTLLGVPLLNTSETIGAFFLSRQEVRPFSDKQIELVKNFAAQAVIAIENARLLNELRQSLERQTATSQVLQVISSSPGDLGQVFATMLENATRICEAKFGALYLNEGDGFRATAMHNAPPAYEEARAGVVHPPPSSSLWRAAKTKQAFQISDVTLEQGYIERDPFVVSAVALGGYRSVLSVPMLHEDELVGVITIFRQEVRPFADKQIALVQNFASQAVIAIENARLLNELRQRTTDLTERTADLTEALEQQTATSEVLSVISSSSGELEPVFQAMLENATRICEAKFGLLLRFDGSAFHLAASVGTPPELSDFLTRRGPFQPLMGSHLDRLTRTKQASHTADYVAEGVLSPVVTLGGARSTVDVPMLKDDELIGAFSIYRQEVRPFSDKQIALVENFAAQAVIAIENARLLNELRQSLEQQTATAQVLQVISSSTGDLAHVFATMLENATRICDAKFGTLYLKERDGFRAAATHNAPASYEEARAKVVHPSPHTTHWQAANTKRPVQIADVTLERGYLEGEPFVVSAFTLGGYRSVLSVPMLHEDQVMGVINIFRQEVSSFSAEHISLLQNFAAQAVIAIENARLLNDLRDRTQQLQAQSEELADLNQQLEQRVADQVGGNRAHE